MNTPVREPPRFVPTLTEVVDPAIGAPVPIGQASSPLQPPDVAALIEQVQRQLQAQLALRLQQQLAQLNALGVQLRSELPALARQTVLDTLSNLANDDLKNKLK